MVLWIGVDDTDSLQGMCTTFLATELVRELTTDNDLIGYPRLVRLNPNVPWKTRGNGAICIRVGEGTGLAHPIGQVGDREIISFPRARGGNNLESVRNAVASLVEKWSRFDDVTTNPGFVVLRHPPNPGFYWRAVRDIVSRSEALRHVQGLGAVQGYKNGRGVIGAIAATSWRPRDRTYEILAYRHRSRWGEPRTIDPSSVIQMDRQFPSTFNNYDYVNNRVVIAPHSPCPVLFGIRGDNPGVLPAARRLIRGESPERWLIFETNQGTDDHVSPRPSYKAHTAGIFSGTVSSAPRSLPGGHVVFGLDGLDVTAYEPSKQFRTVVRRLASGDRVEVIASVRPFPSTLNLEKLRIVSLTRVVRKVSNPVCESCDKRMKSLGRAHGFRCVRCGARAPRSSSLFEEVDRHLEVGWYESPVSARRHLTKPLKRTVSPRSLQLAWTPMLPPTAFHAA